MKLANSFEIKSAPDTVYATLTDIEKVAPCFPGAKLTHRKSDTSYSGEVRVKLGPVGVTFIGEMLILSQDAQARRCTLQARASDRKQRGSVESDIVFDVAATPAGAQVTITSEVNLSGPIAQYGRAAGMIEKVAAKNITQFADALATMIARLDEA